MKCSTPLTLCVHPPDGEEPGADGEQEESGEDDAADELPVHNALLARVQDAAVLPAEGHVLDVARRSGVLHLKSSRVVKGDDIFDMR